MVCHISLFKCDRNSYIWRTGADVPSNERLELLKAAVLLLPDVHRETLQCLLLFLSDVAKQSEHNQASSSP